MSARAGNPFSQRAVLGIVLFGAIAFLLTLYFIGMDEMGNDPNDSGGHASAKGLNGYAALVQLMERRGHTVTVSRKEGDLGNEGLVILTPPHGAKGEDLARIANERRYTGPTIVILPKWMASALPKDQKGVKQGWVELYGPQLPEWEGFADDVSIALGVSPSWRSSHLSGKLPTHDHVLSGSGPTLVPLVRDADGKHVLAGFVQDDGYYSGLNVMAGVDQFSGGEDEEMFPLIFVFEPDLLNNYGMANRSNAMLAEELVDAALNGEDAPIYFDLTQNGMARSMNLLTLAFTPPFLAATLCLIIAAIVVGWRALRRFGPPLAEGRAIAFGKRQLVENSAGFIRRTRRLHLLGPPYATLMRKRIARTLGLPWQEDSQTMDTRIDAALSARGVNHTPFHALTEKLGHARSQNELLRAAEALKNVERMLGR